MQFSPARRPRCQPRRHPASSGSKLYRHLNLVIPCPCWAPCLRTGPSGRARIPARNSNAD